MIKSHGILVMLGIWANGCSSTVKPIQTTAESTSDNELISRSKADDPDIRPSLSQLDVRILAQAQLLLGSDHVWNRADNRVCEKQATTWSLYCALATATNSVGAEFSHRDAVLQEVRFVIGEIAVEKNYQHRLMDYNNDPSTALADIQEVLTIAKSLINLRIRSELMGKRGV
jgi:hypothetical protein